MSGRMRFTGIVPTIEAVLRRHDVPSSEKDLTVEDVLAADAWARTETRNELEHRR